MPDPVMVAEITTSRSRLDQLAAERGRVDAQAALLQPQMTMLLRQGSAAPASQVKTQIDGLRMRRTQLDAEIAQMSATVLRLRDQALAGVDPATAIAELDGTMPVALLPVRLETRFVPNAQELRVRIFPDPIHLHAHEAGLTEEEIQAATSYWLDRWPALQEKERARTSWIRLCASFGAPRAAWIVRSMKPTNATVTPLPAAPTFPDPPRRGAPWTEPVRAVALPDRWLVVGYQAGKRIFAKWGRPVPDTLAFGPTPDPSADDSPEKHEAPAAQQAQLATDDAMKWLVDYQTAVDVGMAVTITAADVTVPGAILTAGIERLIVVGMDWTLDPQAAASRLGSLIEAHRYTEGVELPTQGTPTNNSATASAGYDSRQEALVDAMDPFVQRAALTAVANGRVLARALGLPLDTFDADPGAAAAEQRAAEHMHNALWEATWGYAFDHIFDSLVDDALETYLRDHARRFVRGRGPLPPLRVGNQPYGILPISVYQTWQATNAQEEQMVSLLGRLRPFWTAATGRVPRVGRTARPDRDLMDVLQTTPTSTSFRFRGVAGPTLAANVTELNAAAHAQGLIAQAIGQMLEATFNIRLSHMVLESLQQPLTIPLVTTGPLSETAPLAPNYILEIQQALRRLGGLNLVRGRAGPNTLLQLLLRHAAQLEIAKGSVRLEQLPVAAPLIAMKRSRIEPEFVDVGVSVGDTVTPLRRSVQAVPGITADLSAADYLATTPTRTTVPIRSYDSFVTSLGVLAAVPTAELERLLTETLDLSSHRLDAWFTSVTARRLDALRTRIVPITRQTLYRQGVYLGGFGWVEDLRPSLTRGSRGYVHTPSISHARTAAILRSGHLSHLESNPELLRADLSSERVRTALRLLDGIIEGQSLEALLGYRLERALRDRKLARYILPLRTIAPLARSGDARPAGPLEAVEAHDVVDGVELLKLWKAEGLAFFNRPGLPPANPLQPNPDQANLNLELGRLRDTLDAVNDVMMAEGVYQAVLGNMNRSRSALGALDRQGRPPEPEVVKTPRTGVDYQHRVLLLLQSTVVPAVWAATDAWATASPWVNAWAGSILRSPTMVRFAAEALNASGTVLRRLEIDARELRLSPLGLLAASTAAAAGKPTDLEERLALAFAVHPTLPATTATLRLLGERVPTWPATILGPAELTMLAKAVQALVSGHRPAEARDLALPDTTDATGWSENDVFGIARTVVQAFRTAADKLAATLDNPASTATALRDSLLAAAAAGARGAVPRSNTASGTGASSNGAGDPLVAQAVGIRDAMRKLLDALDADGAAAPDAVPAEERIERATRWIRAILGDEFPVLHPFMVPGGQEVRASLNSRAALLGGDSLAVVTWLRQMGLVRPSVATLARVVTSAELLASRSDPNQLRLIQLPHMPGDRWVALPVGSDAILPAGQLSIVAYAPIAIDPGRPVCGIFVDAWNELLPSPAETTGVAFHYDAPNSRAPQTVLLVVPSNTAVTKWSVSALEGAVLEALELARMRPVDLPALQWMSRFLPALYFAHNPAGDTVSLNFVSAEATARAAAPAGG
jgi:hypothetical protein